MIKNKLNYLVFIYIIFFSCSNKITYKEINRPFYKELKENSKNSFDQYGKHSTINFNEYYENQLFETNFYAKYRNKVIDSLQLFKKEDWLVVQLSGNKFNGYYQKTYLFFENKGFYYNLDIFDIEKPSDIVNILEYSLNQKNNEVIYKIYKMHERKVSNFNNIIFEDLPTSNPLIYYRIIQFKNNRLRFYKMKSDDFKFHKW